MATLNEKLGNRLGQLLGAQGLTTRDLERLCGYYRGHLDELLRGSRPWKTLDLGIQRRIARALGMAYDQLEEALEEPRPEPKPEPAPKPKAKPDEDAPVRRRHRAGPSATSDTHKPDEVL